jgi:hypothetical protein
VWQMSHVRWQKWQQWHSQSELWTWANEPMARAPIWHATQCGMTAVVRSSCTARSLHHSMLVTVGQPAKTILGSQSSLPGARPAGNLTNMTNADSALVTDQNRTEQNWTVSKLAEQNWQKCQNRTELQTQV